MSPWSHSLLLAVALAPCACGEAYSDVGTAFVGAEPQGEDQPVVLTFEADAPLQVWVVHGCAGDRDPEHDCSVDVSGFDVTIHSELVLGRDPNDSCGPSAISHCTGDALPAGDYTLRFGPSTAELAIPSTVPSPVLEGENRD